MTFETVSSEKVVLDINKDKRKEFITIHGVGNQLNDIARILKVEIITVGACNSDDKPTSWVEKDNITFFK